MSSVVTNHWSYLYRRILELKRNDIDGTKMRDKCSEEFPHVTGIQGIWEEICSVQIELLTKAFFMNSTCSC